jgi:lysylphosphatidylglycerol synthetase-like protein (DUF2156 family)
VCPEGDAMHTELWLAYCGYLIWLSAGFGDFICHRVTDLPHTSGVAESFTHLLQLAILGLAFVIGLVFEMGTTITLVVGALVAGHAIVGYWDTRIAFRRRRVLLPVEQHIHSVLDMAPIVAFAWIIARTWPEVVSRNWNVELRMPAASVSTWLALLIPATVLCVVPALVEFRASLKARKPSSIERQDSGVIDRRDF